MARRINMNRIRPRLLAPLLVVALLVCHGLFGALHELSAPVSSGEGAVTSATHAGGGMAGHGAASAGSGLSGHLDDSEYAAATALFLIWGAVLSFGLAARKVRLPLAVRGLVGAPRRPRSSPVFARGTDPPFSQVFRL